MTAPNALVTVAEPFCWVAPSTSNQSDPPIGTNAVIANSIGARMRICPKGLLTFIWPPNAISEPLIWDASHGFELVLVGGLH
jgi:hypothetical protein